MSRELRGPKVFRGTEIHENGNPIPVRPASPRPRASGLAGGLGIGAGNGEDAEAMGPEVDLRADRELSPSRAAGTGPRSRRRPRERDRPRMGDQGRRGIADPGGLGPKADRPSPAEEADRTS
jgi:hypothetical protein